MFRGSVKVYAVLGALVAALSTGLYLSVSKLGEARSEVRAARLYSVQLEGRLRALQERTERIQYQAAQAATHNQDFYLEVQDALDEDQDWSTAPVPDSVRDSLCLRTRCR